MDAHLWGLAVAEVGLLNPFGLSERGQETPYAPIAFVGDIGEEDGEI